MVDRKFVGFVSCALAACALAAETQPAAERPRPRPAQLARIRAGVDLYGIVHWGLNTYTDREWGFGDEDPTKLDPPRFDADQIVGACAAGGLQGLIVVAKHHDGFCLWPTKTTDHNISRSPFRGGKGDYVREMEQACRRHGLRFGVYVSPWDRNNAHYGTDKYVTNVFQRQIAELLSGDYGEVFEMWFDGANGGDGYYGGVRGKRQISTGYYRYAAETFPLVRRLQPSACIFNEMDEADFRFCGNEQGRVESDSRSTGGHFDHVWDHYVAWGNVGVVDGTTFHPVEADFPLRPGWFHHAKDAGKTKCAAYLMQRYLNTVGNAATMNVGIAPNRDGRLDDEDVRALKGLGDLLRLFFSREAKDGEPFNVVEMKEDVSRGERVDGWRLLADGREVLSGKSIGIRRIRTLDRPLTAKSVELKTTSSVGRIGAVTTTRYLVDPDLLKAVLSATTTSGETDTAKWMLGKTADDKSVLLCERFENDPLRGCICNAASWKRLAGAGRAGSGGLVWQANDADPVAGFPIDGFRPGSAVEAEAWVRTPSLTNGTVSVSVEWSNRAGKWAGGKGCAIPYGQPGNETDAEGWTKLTVSTGFLPSDAVRPRLLLCVARGASGTAVFDDVAVRVTERRRVTASGCSAYRGAAAQGPVRFAVGLSVDPDEFPAGTVQANFTYRGTDGQERTVAADRLTSDRATVTLDASQFAPGAQEVVFVLSDGKGGRLGTAKIPFVRLARTTPEPKVRIDGEGRLTVDGKPFFPLGMFWHDDTFTKTPERLDHYASGPFNCLQNYEKDMTTAELDAYWAKGLRVIVSVKDLYWLGKSEPRFALPPRGLETPADEERRLAEVVNRCKAHPALLAWYTCDEIPPEYAERFSARCRSIRALDPDHPQFACGNNPDFVRKALDGYDVFGGDIYPICWKGTPAEYLPPDKAAVWKAAEAMDRFDAASLGVRPQWGVPQAFAWSWEFKDHPEYRFPTALEFRAMLWQEIAAGARGLLIYAYGQMLREWGTPAFERNWKTVCEAAADVKANIPILLKDSGPEVSGMPAQVRVRTWRDESATYALVVNMRSEPIRGAVRIPGVGKVKKLHSGTGVTMTSPERLAIDLAPFAHALVACEGGGGFSE